MKMLTSDEILELRNDIAGLGIPVDHQDELIVLIDAIVVSFIDQEFGLNPVHLSLSSRANYAFNGVDFHANLQHSKALEPVDLGIEGAMNTDSPEGRRAP